jgi:hypothetical protein
LIRDQLFVALPLAMAALFAFDSVKHPARRRWTAASAIISLYAALILEANVQNWLVADLLVVALPVCLAIALAVAVFKR